MAEQLSLDFEEWRKVPNFPYEVSSYGRVRRTEPAYSWHPKTGKAQIHHHAGILRANKTNGYLRINLRSNDGQKRDCLVHTLVCEAFHGPKPGPEYGVAHANGNRSNNHKNNLRWATQEENCNDTSRHGRTLQGRKHPKVKLSDEIVLSIRRQPERSLLDLAREFGVSKKLILNIRKGRTWRHLILE